MQNDKENKKDDLFIVIKKIKEIDNYDNIKPFKNQK
jgi:hypothetical protein